jgi:hypothetical protein
MYFGMHTHEAVVSCDLNGFSNQQFLFCFSVFFSPLLYSLYCIGFLLPSFPPSPLQLSFFFLCCWVLCVFVCMKIHMYVLVPFFWWLMPPCFSPFFSLSRDGMCVCACACVMLQDEAMGKKTTCHFSKAKSPFRPFAFFLFSVVVSFLYRRNPTAHSSR